MHFFSVILMMRTEGVAQQAPEFVSQLGSFCVFLSASRLKERTRAQTLGLNQTVFYLQHQVSYIQSEWKGQGSRHPQAGRGKVLHTRSRIHAPLVPICAHLLRANTPRQTTKHSRSGIREEGYRTSPGNLSTNKQNQETTREKHERWWEPGLH